MHFEFSSLILSSHFSFNSFLILFFEDITSFLRWPIAKYTWHILGKMSLSSKEMLIYIPVGRQRTFTKTWLWVGHLCSLNSSGSSFTFQSIICCGVPNCVSLEHFSIFFLDKGNFLSSRNTTYCFPKHLIFGPALWFLSAVCISDFY